jgi:Flp pilus assembly protein TadB
VFAGDRDRERAAAALREHYVRGRLTLDELSARTGRVLSARTREELRAALVGLPVFLDVSLAARSVARGALLVVFTAAYLVFCLALLIVFGLTVLIHGASASELLAFLLVWLVPTYLLARLSRRRHPS